MRIRGQALWKTLGITTTGVEVAVRADAEGQVPTECEITLQPNFQIVEVDTLTRRSVGLEVLSWSSD